MKPDWDAAKSRLDDAVRKWSRERSEGAGNPPDHEETVKVLLDLIRNLREAAYRYRFAYKYRELDIIDRCDRSLVNDVFVRLRVERRAEASIGQGNPESNRPIERIPAPEYLDFRSMDCPTTGWPADVALRQAPSTG